MHALILIIEWWLLRIIEILLIEPLILLFIIFVLYLIGYKAALSLGFQGIERGST